MIYELAPDIENIAFDIVGKLGMFHIKLNRVAFIRSRGSKSRHTLARIHGLSKIMQVGMKIKAHYAIEVISENFDKLNEEEKEKTVLHELMHIPKNFGGGFRNHRPYVTKRTVDKAYKEYLRMCEK